MGSCEVCGGSKSDGAPSSRREDDAQPPAAPKAVNHTGQYVHTKERTGDSHFVKVPIKISIFFGSTLK